MSAFTFRVTKQPVFGTYGEFTVGGEPGTVRAQFLMTKVRPANDGTWESDFASMMVPWREIFKLEEMSFDELLQRDLDDSRVAHDLVPYLLGHHGTAARFFPPVLAVIVPKNVSGSGIEPYYPPIKDKSNQRRTEFGDLFDFEPVVLNNEPTPFGVISYNRQRSAFIIVDGQHRAMAVLGLYRQLTKSWGNSAYESYYQHIGVTAEDVSRIELPVCLVYFPDLCSDNKDLIARGIDLRHVCREIFLVVNRTAKQVSSSRQLLLDDDDFCARMMRRTLSKLKDRRADEVAAAKIYSISYGDSEEIGRAVLAGQLEYSSAIAIHKIHMITSFCNPAIFRWENPADASDGRSLKNPGRPAEILAGTPLSHWLSLSRKSAMEHEPSDVDRAVALLGEVTDSVLLRLFDGFRPFSIQNEAISLLRLKLTQPESKADPVQNKCFNLLFEGSGVKAVFEEHFQRLTNLGDEAIERGETVPQYVAVQVEYCKAVEKALESHETEIRRRRACSFFNINYDAINQSVDASERWRALENRAKTIFDTISTQAFQIGFQMAILSVAHEMLPANPTYPNRSAALVGLVDLYVRALNAYFAPDNETQHKSLTGYFTEPRAQVFDPQGLGLRGLLRLSVGELNERQWVFFRYAILEIVHSVFASEAVSESIKNAAAGSFEERYRSYLPALTVAIVKMRDSYIQDAETAALKTSEFKTRLITLEVEKKAAGWDEAQIRKALDDLSREQRKNANSTARQHIKASVGKIETAEQLLNRLVGTSVPTVEARKTVPEAPSEQG